MMQEDALPSALAVARCMPIFSMKSDPKSDTAPSSDVDVCPTCTAPLLALHYAAGRWPDAQASTARTLKPFHIGPGLGHTRARLAACARSRSSMQLLMARKPSGSGRHAPTATRSIKGSEWRTRNLVSSKCLVSTRTMS